MGDPWVVPIVVRGLSVGYACYPWVTPVGFTHGCVLATALRFLLPLRGVSCVTPQFYLVGRTHQIFYGIYFG